MSEPPARSGTAWLDTLDQARQRALLLDVISLGSSVDDLAALSAAATATVARVCGADRCLLYVMDEHRRRLTVSGSWPAAAGTGPVVVPVGAGIAGWVASHVRPLLSSVATGEPNWRDSPELTGVPAGPNSTAVGVPLGEPGAAPCGVLAVVHADPGVVTAPEVERLLGIGRLLTPALAAARHHQHLHSRELSRHRSTEEFVALQESERRRLAAEVHDGVGQRIVGLAFHLVAAAESLADRPGFAAAQLATARELAGLAEAEVRSAVEGLRPPLLDDLGLADALASLGRRTPGLEVAVEVRIGQDVLADHVATSLYRIAQEAMQNIIKHAGAARATIELYPSAGSVVLRVTDDGDGFDPEDQAAGHGLRIMRERAELIGAHLDLVSRPGVGTTATLRLPLAQAGSG